MENKEVESSLKIIKCIYDGDFLNTIYDEPDYEDSLFNECLEGTKGYIEQLEKENAELKQKIGTDDTIDVMVYSSMMVQEHKIKKLKQQLAAKDKALDKACNELSKGLTTICPFEALDGVYDCVGMYKYDECICDKCESKC